MATKILNGLDLTGTKITNVASPSAATDATNKQYVDNVAAGLDGKPSVRMSSTANLVLSGLQTVDGVTGVAGDRVLARHQTAGAENRVWVMQSTAWTAPTDATQGQLTSGAFVSVEEGSVYGSKSFNLTTPNPVTVGTTSLTWSPFALGQSYAAGNGLSLTSGTFAVVAGSGVIADGASTRIDPAYTGLAKRYAINVPAGATTAAITHNLGTLDVEASVYEVATGALVFADVALTSINVVSLTFGTAPTASQYRAVIIG